MRSVNSCRLSCEDTNTNSRFYKRNSAFIFFCSSRDPCSCSGGPYRKYYPLCSFLAETNVTKLREYNHYGYPGLPAKFITELGNNRTFGLDLEAFRTLHKSPIEYIPATIREALLTGFLVCIGIIGMMYAMSILLEGAGVDEATMTEKRREKASAELKVIRKSLESRGQPPKVSGQVSQDEASSANASKKTA